MTKPGSLAFQPDISCGEETTCGHADHELCFFPGNEGRRNLEFRCPKCNHSPVFPVKIHLDKVAAVPSMVTEELSRLQQENRRLAAVCNALREKTQILSLEKLALMQQPVVQLCPLKKTDERMEESKGKYLCFSYLIIRIYFIPC